MSTNPNVQAQTQQAEANMVDEFLNLSDDDQQLINAIKVS
jgi:hypothetical protein